MNKRQVIASLNEVANELDNSGMFNEATELTNVMKRLSQNSSLIGNSGLVGVGANYAPGIQNMIPTMQKPYEAQGPHQNTGKNTMEYAGAKKEYQGKNPMQYSGYVDPKIKQQRGMSAQQWINANSNLVGGDVNKLIQNANQAFQMGGMGKELHNDIMYMLNLRTNKGLGAVRKQDATPQPNPRMGLA